MTDTSKINIERINDLNNKLEEINNSITIINNKLEEINNSITTINNSITTISNTLNNKIQLVSSLPSNPTNSVLYCIPE